MDTVRLIVKIVFMILSVIMTIIVLMQEGKSQGLGSLSGSTIDNSYWSKNKGRSMEGVLVKVTRVLLIIFLAGAAAMNIGSFQG
ncbi:MAG: preprotein translocase subunit SecG [Clostridiales bacterium]|nr:preprotein translocase subunit SecG [Clostridiales bacterium]